MQWICPEKTQQKQKSSSDGSYFGNGINFFLPETFCIVKLEGKLTLLQ